MNKRLIDIINDAQARALDTIGSMNNGSAAWYAERLEKAGVFVPPYALEECVWLRLTSDGDIVKAKVIGIELDVYTIPAMWIAFEYEDPELGIQMIRRRVDVCERTVVRCKEG